MLRRWFNNPYVVGALAAVALGYAAFSAMPGSDATAQAAYVDEPAFFDPTEPFLDTPLRGSTRLTEANLDVVRAADRQTIGWPSTMPRDPFAPVIESPPAPPSRLTDAAPNAAVPAYDVSAIFIAALAGVNGPSRRSAVIDGALRQVGDSLGEHTVTAIEPHRVLISKDGLTYEISPKDRSTP